MTTVNSQYCSEKEFPVMRYSLWHGSGGSIQNAKLQRTRRCSTEMELSTEASTSTNDDDDGGVVAAADDGFQQSGTNDD
jgi:hypothetical protein